MREFLADLWFATKASFVSLISGAKTRELVRKHPIRTRSWRYCIEVRRAYGDRFTGTGGSIVVASSTRRIDGFIIIIL